MEIIPSIDLRLGDVVRLHQGDYAKQTTFNTDPVRVAQQFVEAGATRIHLVDLDGALEGSPVQKDLCAEVAHAVTVPVQVGGGFRTAEHIAMALKLGIDRVVIGTAAVEEPQLVKRAVAAHGAARLVVGLDARDGMVAVNGWTKTTGVSALDLMAKMHDAGVRRFLYTDIARDGTLSSPDFDALAEMAQRAAHLSPDTAIIASGGIANIEHLRRLTTIGVEAAIIGSAIYRGTVDLQQAVAELKGT